MKQVNTIQPSYLLLPSALLLSIPAFYLVLSESDGLYRLAGQLLYALEAVFVGAHLYLEKKGDAAVRRTHRERSADIVIFVCALISVWPPTVPWSAVEWVLRLGYCGIVFVRLIFFVARYIGPPRLLQIYGLALLTLAIAGGGFLLLEPKVKTYADGLWLAFVTGATVGYGDLVPTTPASRIFAAFTVLLGYAFLSVVTASIAALLVGEDEKRLRRELHTDMHFLRGELISLRSELASLRAALDSPQSHRPG